MRRIFILLCLGYAVMGQAKTLAPESLHIKNDQQAQVTLSNVDINRLFVAGDRITTLHAPQSRLQAHNDASGSIFTNVVGSSPFTAFVTTQSGRHLSLLVVPKSIPGVTVRLIPTSPMHFHYAHHYADAVHYEKSSPYEATLLKVLRAVILGGAPSGYTQVAPKAFSQIDCFKLQPLLHTKHLAQTVNAGYLGGELAVRVLTLKNTSRHPLTLQPSDLYQSGVRAISLENTQIPSHKTLRVYEVVTND